jgi:hypothetical protein
MNESDTSLANKTGHFNLLTTHVAAGMLLLAAQRTPKRSVPLKVD